MDRVHNHIWFIDPMWNVLYRVLRCARWNTRPATLGDRWQRLPFVEYRRRQSLILQLSNGLLLLLQEV